MSIQDIDKIVTPEDVANLKTEVDQIYDNQTTATTGDATGSYFSVNANGSMYFHGGQISTTPGTIGGWTIGTQQPISSGGYPPTVGYIQGSSIETEKILKEVQDIYKLLAILYKDISEIKDKLSKEED